MRIPTYVTDELERDGYTVARNPNTFDVAAVHAHRGAARTVPSTAALIRGMMGWRWRCSGAAAFRQSPSR